MTSASVVAEEYIQVTILIINHATVNMAKQPKYTLTRENKVVLKLLLSSGNWDSLVGRVLDL